MKILEFMCKEWPLLLLVAVPVIMLAIYSNEIPSQVPIHWGLQGEVNSYGSKYTMPLVNLGLYFLLVFIPIIDPRKKNYDIFSTSYRKIRLVVTLFFSTIICVNFASYLGFDIDLTNTIMIGVYLLLVALGNYFSTIKPNWFIGIRTPWTLESDQVWRKTHALAGKLWFWLGLLGILLTFLLPAAYLMPVQGTLIGVMGIWPVAYSFVLYKKYQKV